MAPAQTKTRDTARRRAVTTRLVEAVIALAIILVIAAVLMYGPPSPLPY